MTISISGFIRRNLQTLSVGFNAFLFFLAPLVGLLFFIYITTTRFWWLALCYSAWLYFDRNTPSRGGRPISWVRNLKLLQYAIDYFPVKLEIPENVTLNPEKNYLFCCFPHGVLALAPFHTFSLPTTKFQKLYPKFKVRLGVLGWLGFMPFLRDLGLALNFISCSAESLRYVLTRPEGGHAVLLVPGGAAEACLSQPGRYKLFLKRRKGFAKIALESGAALVPVLTFGEPDLYQLVETRTVRPFQDFVRSLAGFVPVLFYGRWIPLVPQRVPLISVLGAPIEVVRVENPTKQQIDELHEIFTRSLVDLFEEYKYKYLEQPKDKALEFE